MLFNEPFSPTFSTTHNIPPYYDLTITSKHSGSDHLDPTSSKLDDIQATTDSERTLSVPADQPIPEPSEPELTLRTFDKALATFSESSASMFKKLSDESNTSEKPSEVRTNWNKFIRWMTSKIFKMKSLSEQVKNDFIRSVEEMLEARLAKEAEKKAEREVAEKDAKEAAEKATAKAAAKEKDEKEAEAARVAEVAQKVESEKSLGVAPT